MEVKVENFKRHPHWAAVEKVLRTLHQAGHTAYLAGGCVRDALLGRTPKDFDVATSALPDEVEKIFPTTVAVGKAFGVILVVQDGVPVEVTTFRLDGEYRDGRRPDKVEFRSAKEDAERRDFTVNALFYDLQSHKVVDYVGGREDLKNKLIRTVGDPQKRFDEDKLRILRGVRFASVLGFQIEEKTWQAICQFAKSLKVVSQERITDELQKMSSGGDAPTGFQLLREAGISTEIFADFKILDDKHWAQAWRGLVYLGHAPGFKRILTWLAFSEVELTGESSTRHRRVQQIESWLKTIRLSREFENAISFTLRQSLEFRKFDTSAFFILAEENGPLLLEMQQTLFYVLGHKSEDQKLSDFIERYMKVANSQGGLPENFLNGDDLIAAGIQKGPRFGEILREAHVRQLEGELRSRPQALEWLKGQVS